MMHFDVLMFLWFRCVDDQKDDLEWGKERGGLKQSENNFGQLVKDYSFADDQTIVHEMVMVTSKLFLHE